MCTVDNREKNRRRLCEKALVGGAKQKCHDRARLSLLDETRPANAEKRG